MTRFPESDREEMVIALARLVEALTTVGLSLSRDLADDTHVWADQDNLYLEAIVDPLQNANVDICFQAGRLFLTASHD